MLLESVPALEPEAGRSCGERVDEGAVAPSPDLYLSTTLTRFGRRIQRFHDSRPIQKIDGPAFESL